MMVLADLLNYIDIGDHYGLLTGRITQQEQNDHPTQSACVQNLFHSSPPPQPSLFTYVCFPSITITLSLHNTVLCFLFPLCVVYLRLCIILVSQTPSLCYIGCFYGNIQCLLRVYECVMDFSILSNCLDFLSQQKYLIYCRPVLSETNLIISQDLFHVSFYSLQ